MAERGRFLEGLIYPFYIFPYTEETNEKVMKILQEFEQKLRENKIRYSVSTFAWSIRVYISKKDKSKVGKDLIWELKKIHNKQFAAIAKDDSQN